MLQCKCEHNTAGKEFCTTFFFAFSLSLLALPFSAKSQKLNIAGSDLIFFQLQVSTAISVLKGLFKSLGEPTPGKELFFAYTLDLLALSSLTIHSTYI